MKHVLIPSYRALIAGLLCALVGGSLPVHAAVMISEIMYDPQNSDTNREWVELYNTSTSPVDLSGWQFGRPNINAWTSAFPSGTTLGAHQALVITPSISTFDSDWGNGKNRIQVSNFPNLLNNPGANDGRIAIRNSAGIFQDELSYRDGSGWPSTSGGDGHSIYVLPQHLNPTSNDSGGSWRPSSQGLYGAYWRGAGGDSENHASPGFVATQQQAPFAPSPDAAWSMVVLPDTQNYVARPASTGLLQGQMNWIKNNKDAFNIQLVMQEGDIVNRNSGTASNGVTAVQQWTAARDAFSTLNGVVPYIMATGNHDYGITNSQSRDTKFNNYFKASDNPLIDPDEGGILKGVMNAGELQNAYYEFTAPDGRDMLIFSLEYWPRNNVVNWAKGIAQQPQYADHTAVLLTHSYIGSANQRWNVGADAHPMEGGNDGVDLWNKLVKVAGNFEMTFNGHIGGDGIGYRVDTSDAGDQVHQMLFNAQFETNAGNGWLRLVEFLEDGTTVRVRTYSPHFDLYRTNAANSFEFTLSPITNTPLVWNDNGTGGTVDFASGFATSNGSLGVGAYPVDPFASDKEELLIGYGGNASLSGAGVHTIGSLAVGTDQPGALIAGRSGDGALATFGTTSLIISDSSTTGDLAVGEGGYRGQVTWGSSGLLEVQGRFRVGQGGEGVFTQENGIVVAGNTPGSLKFLAIGHGAGGDGTYNLHNGYFRPSGGFAGTEFRQTRVGDDGGTGVLNVGDDSGVNQSARFESNDDLFIGRNGGTGTMYVRSDALVELRTSSNAANLLVGQGGTGTVIQTGGLVTSDSLVRIGSDPGGVGHYTISGGVLATATDGEGTLQIARNGATGTLRIEGTGQVFHGAELFVANEANTGSTGRLELIGSGALLEIGQLENAPGGANGMSETIFWQADAGGITPIIVTGAGPLAADRVQLQDPTELSENSGLPGSLQGDGIALELDLSALTSSTILTLIDNETSDPITGYFENAQTMDLYEEGDEIFGTGFQGTVTITYMGGTGNDVLLHLVAAALMGDYNEDGVVDTADYIVWRRTGINGVQGYEDWRANFGATSGGGAVAPAQAPVPEPSALGLFVVALVALAASRNRNS